METQTPPAIDLLKFCSDDLTRPHLSNPFNDGDWTYLSADDPQEPMDLIAGYCRILDEADLLVSGKTEIEAIRALCDYNDLPFDL